MFRMDLQNCVIFSICILFLEAWRWMSVLVLAGVEVVSDEKVDENVMVEAK